MSWPIHRPCQRQQEARLFTLKPARTPFAKPVVYRFALAILPGMTTIWLKCRGEARNEEFGQKCQFSPEKT
jgi:hypothetical protein